MRYDQIVRAKDGTDRHIVQVDEVRIPDLWHSIEAIKEGKLPSHEQADEICECWTLCHDLLKHVKRICEEKQA